MAEEQAKMELLQMSVEHRIHVSTAVRACGKDWSSLSWVTRLEYAKTNVQTLIESLEREKTGKKQELERQNQEWLSTLPFAIRDLVRVAADSGLEERGRATVGPYSDMHYTILAKKGTEGVVSGFDAEERQVIVQFHKSHCDVYTRHSGYGSGGGIAELVNLKASPDQLEAISETWLSTLPFEIGSSVRVAMDSELEERGGVPDSAFWYIIRAKNGAQGFIVDIDVKRKLFLVQFDQSQCEASSSTMAAQSGKAKSIKLEARQDQLEPIVAGSVDTSRVDQAHLDININSGNEPFSLALSVSA